jgi:hypothetical protein
VEAGSCTSIEYGITPGIHRVLRFTVSTPNIGDADAVVGDPLAHVDPNHDGDFSDSNGLFAYTSCHNHFHYKHYATYELLPVLQGGALGAPIFARKRGFCMRAITATTSQRCASRFHDAPRAASLMGDRPRALLWSGTA